MIPHLLIGQKPLNCRIQTRILRPVSLYIRESFGKINQKDGSSRNGRRVRRRLSFEHSRQTVRNRIINTPDVVGINLTADGPASRSYEGEPNTNLRPGCRSRDQTRRAPHTFETSQRRITPQELRAHKHYTYAPGR